MPLEVVSIMYTAVLDDDGQPMVRPNPLNTRRWLKVLIDRSLVLGTVDRPALHDVSAMPLCLSLIHATPGIFE